MLSNFGLFCGLVWPLQAALATVHNSGQCEAFWQGSALQRALSSITLTQAAPAGVVADTDYGSVSQWWWATLERPGPLPLSGSGSNLGLSSPDPRIIRLFGGRPRVSSYHLRRNGKLESDPFSWPSIVSSWIGFRSSDDLCRTLPTKPNWWWPVWSDSCQYSNQAIKAWTSRHFWPSSPDLDPTLDLSFISIYTLTHKNPLVSLCKREYQGTVIELNICNISATFNIISTVTISKLLSQFPEMSFIFVCCGGFNSIGFALALYCLYLCFLWMVDL